MFKKFWYLIKKYRLEILIFLICFVLSFLYSSFLFFVGSDEIWNFGFSYNISQGLVIYKDFNVLQMPLFFMIGSLFIKIFGDFLISLHILNAIIIASIIVICYKIIGFRCLFLFLCFLIFPVPGYNFLSLFFVFVIIYLVHSNKDNDFLLGLVGGLLFLTKQNIGICLFIPILFFSKNKIKCFSSFCIPVLCLLIYFVYNDAVYDFINCCFLGMLDFNENNKFLTLGCFFVEIFSCLYLIFCFVKYVDKRKIITYIFMFQIMAYPICDIGHTLWAFIPVFFLIIYLSKVSYFYFLIGIVFSFVFALTFFANFSNLQRFDGLYFFRNVGSQVELIDELDLVNKYYNDGNKIFYVSGDAYFFKLYLNREIDNYDLILNGNMGYNGSQKWIDGVSDVCSKEKCVFFVLKEKYYEVDFTQLNMDIFSYVVDNYYLIDSDVRYYVYSNIES